MKKNCLFRRIIIICFIIIPSYYGAAQQYNDFYISSKFKNLIPENWETRSAQKEVLESNNQIPGIWTGRYLQEEDNAIIQYKIEFSTDEFVFYKFIREDENGRINELKAGNISFKRNINTYQYEYMTILIKDDRDDSYIRIYPLNRSSSVIDVKLYNTFIYKNVVLPLSFDTLLTIPFSYIAELSSSIINWESIFYTQKPENGIWNIVNKIREYLHFFKREEDAAFDSSGNPVFIESGLSSGGGVNCAGFVKWVADGLYYPYTNKYMDINLLNKKNLESRGNFYSKQYEEQEDPYFGIDWDRNISVILNEARLGIKIDNPEEYDVRNVDFFYYTEDIGYRIIDLRLIFYILSQKNPGNFYLGSINNQRFKPSLRKHSHVAVFFPVYYENGQFDVIVMEDGYETSLNNFINNYGYYTEERETANEYIHLTEIYGKGEFEPLDISQF